MRGDRSADYDGGRPDGRAAPGIIVWKEDGVTVAIFWTFARDSPAPSTASLVAIANDLVRTETT